MGCQAFACASRRENRQRPSRRNSAQGWPANGWPRVATCLARRSVRDRCMNSRLCFLFVLAVFGLGIVDPGLVSAPHASAQEQSDADTVKAMELKWTESYKQRQVAILSSLLAEGFVITIEDGSTYSKTGYISHTAEPGVQVQVAEMSDIKVRMHGNTAVVTGAYHEVGTSDGKRYEYRDRFTDVWMKMGGKWQVVASHYSVPVK